MTPSLRSIPCPLAVLRPSPILRLLAIVAVCCAVLPLAAAWEDTGVPASSRRPAGSAATAAPSTGRRAPSTATGARPSASTPGRGAPRGAVPADLYSTFLDTQTEPLYWMSLAYVGGTQIGDQPDEVSQIELDGAWRLADLRNLLLGDLDLKLRLHSVFFTGDAGLDLLPTALLALPLDAGWTWRFLDGTSFQFRAMPGLYADVEALGDGLALPFQLAWYRAVAPDLSVLVGVELRPGWDLLAVPLVGCAWEPSDVVRVQLAIPRSRVDLFLGPLTVFAAGEWRNTTYAMSGSDGEPDELTLDDIQLSTGTRVRLSEERYLSAELGTFLDRTLTAEGGDGKDDVSMSGSWFLRLGWGGPF